MQAILDPKSFVSDGKSSIVTLGVFDGIHLGHKKILEETTRWAAETGSRSVVLTFRRHPEQLLRGQAPPAVTSLEHRLVLLERAGVDLAIVLHFDESLRALSAEQFSRIWFAEKLHARGVVLGPDNAIGKNREGNATRLREVGRELGFEVRQAARASTASGKPVSSTAIREALRSGDLAAAGEMLGRTPSIYGTVIHGDSRGRTLGIPTANLNLHHEFTPGRGVYFGWAQIEGKRVACLVNIGNRPTFKSGEDPDTAEAHLLDFQGSIYGATMEIDLVERLRDEMKFPDAAGLKAQIARDIARARELMQKLPQG